ncbi:MAG: thiamine phosphate synthase [Erysipelotrichaceae bacterium]
MKIIAITNHSFFSNHDDFINHILKLDKACVDKIILRDKDLTAEAYLDIATILVAKLQYSKLVIHSRKAIADKLKLNSIHLSYDTFIKSPLTYKNMEVSISIHSLKEAIELNKHNISFILVSHIFPTECKKDLEPKGIEFLKTITAASKHSIYALGGITPSNISLLSNSCIEGVTLMSSLMTTQTPSELIYLLKSNYIML